jgi:uncharacterized membrane protein YhhN
VKLSGRARLAYAALAAVDSVLAGSSRPLAHRARFVTKPLLMPLLATSLASSARALESPLRTPVLAAQAGAWVGDVGLLSEKRVPFLVGTTGFALGHAAYVSGFHPLRTRTSRVYDERPARALAALWLVAGPALGLAARRDGMGWPVTAYSAALTAMAVSATRLSSDVPSSARRLAAAGALTFLASDSTLGLRKFVLPDAPAAMEAAVMATYTSAQLMLSEAAARA